MKTPVQEVQYIAVTNEPKETDALVPEAPKLPQESEEVKKDEVPLPIVEVGGVSMPLHTSCRPMQQISAPVVIFPIGSPVRADVSFRFKSGTQSTNIKSKNDNSIKPSSGRSYGSKYVCDEVYLPPGFHMDNSTKSTLTYSTGSPSNLNSFDTRDKTWSRNISEKAKESSWRLSFNRPEYQSQYMEENMYFTRSP